MNRSEANEEAKKIYDKWRRDKERIEEKAKKEGKWKQTGLDGNNHLFKEIDEEAKEQLRKLESKIDK